MKIDELKEDNGSAQADETKLKRNVEYSSTFISIYANDTQIQTGPWDVRFQFGLVQDVDKATQTITIQQVADVRMSPQHAKRIAVLLQQQVDTYEKMFGTIPSPQT